MTDLETGTPEAPAKAPTRLGGVLTVYTAVAFVLVLGLVAGIVILALDRSSKHHQATERTEALGAAEKAMAVFGSFSYTTYDADQAKVKAVVTPRLETQLTMNLAPLKASVVEEKVTSKTAVRNAQVIDVPSSTSVRVLVFFDQQSTKAGQSAPMLSPSAFTLTMQKINGTWLVDRADASG